jgi:hypothetical protein
MLKPRNRVLGRGVAKITHWIKNRTSAWSGKEGWIDEWKLVYNAEQKEFDKTFALYAPEGDFLGEWGIGTNPSVQMSPGQYVYAFEIWLFDKANVWTATQLIVSPQALTEGLDQDKLAGKGEAHAATPGLELNLETQNLKLIAQLDDVTFVDLPEGSSRYFQSATLTFTAYNLHPFKELDEEEEEEEIVEPQEALAVPEARNGSEFETHNEPDLHKRIEPIEESEDPLFGEARKLAEEYEQVSISMFQRRFRIGYTRAVRLINRLVESGVLKRASGEGKYVLVYQSGKEE